MWISKSVTRLLKDFQEEIVGLKIDLAGLVAENNRLQIENARLRSDLDWFKLRLNQVERERGMLIQAAIGVKIAVPEFVPTFNPDEALNPMNNPFQDLTEMRGMDGVMDNPKEDFSMMPGFAERR
jgi:hypothetical protein